MRNAGGVEPADPRVPDSWHGLLGAIRARGRAGRVYVLGGPDTGKSTLCRWLWTALAGEAGTALVSCDPGQAEIGPPGAVAMTAGSPEDPDPPLLRLVGSVSPPGHLLQTLSGVLRLAGEAEDRGAEGVVCDSSGFATGDVAREFQHQLIDTLLPRHLVAIQNEEELEPILRCFQGPSPEVHRLEVSGAVRPRSREERRQRRRERFRRYFQGSGPLELDLDGLGLHGHVPDLEKRDELRGLLVAPCDRDGFALCLALVRRMWQRDGRVELLAPPFSPRRVATLQFGSLRLEPDGREMEGS